MISRCLPKALCKTITVWLPTKRPKFGCDRIVKCSNLLFNLFA